LVRPRAVAVVGMVVVLQPSLERDREVGTNQRALRQVERLHEWVVLPVALDEDMPRRTFDKPGAKALAGELLFDDLAHVQHGRQGVVAQGRVGAAVEVDRVVAQRH
jgi:hypothetical protein